MYNFKQQNMKEDRSHSSSAKSFGAGFVSRIINFFTPRPSLEQSITEIIEEHEAENGPVTNEETKILRNVLEFGETEISDIMIPRSDIIAVNRDIALKDLNKIFLENGHTRIPVYQETLDNVIGFIHIKDVFKKMVENSQFTLDDIMRKILIVAPSMKLDNLLYKMKASRVHIAIVVDEYGGTDGLLTIEDLVEEIVGEIEDEHDQDTEHKYSMISDGIYEVGGRLPIEDFEKLINMKISEERSEDIDTVSGLVCAIAGHIPVRGEKIPYENLVFEIKDADPRHVKSIIIHKTIG